MAKTFFLFFFFLFRWKNFSTSPKIKSNIKANRAISILPVIVIIVLFVVIPLYMATPRPPAPINEAIPANAIVIITIFLIPDIITGRANGSFILYNIWKSVLPIPLAASRIFLSTLVIPVYVFLTIGNNA